MLGEEGMDGMNTLNFNKDSQVYMVLWFVVWSCHH
jgi:hypothetical protein